MDNLDDIQNRNARVEADKAWETSFTRRVLIACGTYIVAFSYLRFLQVDQAHLHALVPAGAYMISTLTLPVFKRLWIARVYQTALQKEQK